MADTVKSLEQQLSQLYRLGDSIRKIEENLAKGDRKLAALRAKEVEYRKLILETDLLDRPLETLWQLRARLKNEVNSLSRAALETEKANLTQKKQALEERAEKLEAIYDYTSQYQHLMERWVAVRKRVNTLERTTKIKCELQQLEEEHSELLMTWRRYNEVQDNIRQTKEQNRTTSSIVRELAEKLGILEKADTWLEMLSRGKEANFMAEIRSLIEVRKIELAEEYSKLDKLIDKLRRKVDHQRREVFNLENDIRALEGTLEDIKERQQSWYPQFDEWYAQALRIWEFLQIETPLESPERDWHNPEVYKKIKNQLEPHLEALSWYDSRVQEEEEEARRRQTIHVEA